MSPPGRSGFTLVEVLVSLVVLEVGLMGALGLLLLATRATARAARVEAATAAATSIADSLLSAPSVSAGAGERNGRAARWAPVPTGVVVRVEIDPGDSLEIFGPVRGVPDGG